MNVRTEGGHQPKGGRPSRGDADDLTRRIIEAGLDAFCENGFAGTTFEDVAARASTTRRSVNHRFPEKDDLLIAACKLLHQQELSRHQKPPSLDNDDALEALRKGLHDLLLATLNPRTVSFFRVICGEASRLEPVSQIVLTFSDDIERIYEKLLINAQHEAKFRRLSASAMATAIVGLFVSNPVNRAMMGDPKFTNPHDIELYFSQAWAIFLAIA